MRVVYRIRSDWSSYPGGDYTMLSRLMEEMQVLGVECEFAPGLAPLHTKPDIVHIFNLTRVHEPFLQAKNALELGAKVVVTPIWHSVSEMKRFYSRLYRIYPFPIWLYHSLKEFLYARRSGLPIHPLIFLRYKAMQQALARRADAILPNSYAEWTVLQNELQLRLENGQVIPNGFDNGSETFRIQRRERMLCVGRIEPRKNTLSAILAFKAAGVTGSVLEIYGSISDAHRRYWNKVERELIPGRVSYEGVLEAREMRRRMCGAAVLVHPSFFETTGLVALEALSAGANVCIYDSPYTREQFGSAVEYCDPYRIESIRDAIIRAKEKSELGSLPAISTWAETAVATLAVYKRILGI